MPALADQDARTGHPYHTYDMISEQPTAIQATLQECEMQAPMMRSYQSGIEQYILTGCGTSYHAALAGSYTLYALFQKTSAVAVQSFELTHYFRRLNPKTLVTAFSHTGNTKTTLDAVHRAKSSGAFTLGLTGRKESNLEKVADKTMVVGNGPERSRAHTKSYTSALFASMYLSADFIANEAVNPVAESLLCQLSDVPKAMDSALKSERLMKDLVNETQETVDRFIFVGSGPNVATALEAALKMKETSYAAAEGFELEQFLHGPWVSLDRSQMVLLIAPKGPSYQRYFDLLSVCNRLKVPSVAITDDKHIKELASHCVWMEDISEELSPLTYIIPLQLFAYQSTLAKRINPDYIHYDDPDIWEARQIVFPPGTH